LSALREVAFPKGESGRWGIVGGSSGGSGSAGGSRRRSGTGEGSGGRSKISVGTQIFLLAKICFVLLVHIEQIGLTCFRVRNLFGLGFMLAKVLGSLSWSYTLSLSYFYTICYHIGMVFNSVCICLSFCCLYA